VLSGIPGVDIDYVAVADFEGRPTLAIAARVGQTRLIDNAPLVVAPQPELERTQGILR
jgi:hypothetical protein